ncbi:MAG TPA: RsmE family RNA methyltransferase [Candidatus Cloacimonadota bacterium]|nr:RsmE family RNA methyltransferase [Candidatus Cloacimonadota bacterium]
MPSYIIDSVIPQPGDQVKLQGAEHHHLAMVTRHKPGDKIKLNNTKGWLGLGSILQISRSETIIRIDEALPAPQMPQYALAFSLLKSQNDELVIEKGTELGVCEFFPFVSRYTVRRAGEAALARFHKLALASVKQCDNPRIPVINKVQDFAECLESIRLEGYTPIICSESRPDLWLSDVALEGVKPCFVVGPEGGWSPEEYELFESFNLTQICLGSLVTRAETASIAIAAQYLLIAKTIN